MKTGRLPVKKVVFCGPTKSGKTWAANQIAHGKVPDNNEYTKTKGVDFFPKLVSSPTAAQNEDKESQVSLQIWDTSGNLANFNQHEVLLNDNQKVYNDVDIFVLFVDLTQDLNKQQYRLQNLIGCFERFSPNAPVILAVSKTDVDASKKILSDEDIQTLQESLHIHKKNVVKISAINNINMGTNDNGLLAAILNPYSPDPDIRIEDDLENRFENMIEALGENAEVITNEHTKVSGEQFKDLLTQAKETLIDELKRGEIYPDTALQLAAATSVLTAKVANCTVTTSDLNRYITNGAVQEHMKKSSRFSSVIGGIIGAVLGVIVRAVVGAALGAGTGPGVILTAITGAIAGAVAGGIIGAAGLKSTGKKLSLWNNPIAGLHQKAKEVVNQASTQDGEKKEENIIINKKN